MVKKRKFTRRYKSSPTQVGALMFALLEKMGGSPARSKLMRLWEQWDNVMGEELALLATPVGSRGNILIIHADNAIHMQELHFWSQEIRKRVNSFLKEEYFVSIRTSFEDGGKNCHDKENFAEKKIKKTERTGVISHLSGCYLKEMDMASPVARCYAIFMGKKG